MLIPLPIQSVLHPPDDPVLWPEWRLHVNNWAEAERKILAYNGSAYWDPAFEWTQRNFCCFVLMLWDRELYDAKVGIYQIDRLLDRGERMYGGYDSILLWSAYPRIGIDERNQFDHYRDLPGGLGALRRLVDDCHQRGVRCFIPYMPWDQDSRREANTDMRALLDMVKFLDVDGVFLDTLSGGVENLRNELDKIKPGIVMCPEIVTPVEQISTHHMSWMEGATNPTVPGLIRNRLFEQRHMTYSVNRWSSNHTYELHQTWLNAAGFCVWENVFGDWIGTDRECRSLLKRMLPVLRRFADVWTQAEWTMPLSTLCDGVYAARWEGEGICIWNLCNRAKRDVDEVLLQLPHVEGSAYYDVMRGIQLSPSVADGIASICLMIRCNDISCLVISSVEQLGAGWDAFLNCQNELYRDEPLTPGPPLRLDHQLLELPVVCSSETVRREPEMARVEVISEQPFSQEVRYRLRECGFIRGLEQETWRERHDGEAVVNRIVKLESFYIDITPVTNQQYAIFLKDTSFQPTDSHNFLKHFVDGLPPEGEEDHPVVYVSLEDARAYAVWAGKRLPREEEWQYAAQGPEQRVWPWGDTWDSSRLNCGSVAGHPSECRQATPVKKFPQGRSVFGCYDMCGNTWELTEGIRTDGHTNYIILKGGSYYRTNHSAWYFDGGPRPPAWSAKYILYSDSLDRSAVIGFRCAADR